MLARNTLPSLSRLCAPPRNKRCVKGFFGFHLDYFYHSLQVLLLAAEGGEKKFFAGMLVFATKIFGFFLSPPTVARKFFDYTVPSLPKFYRIFSRRLRRRENFFKHIVSFTYQKCFLHAYSTSHELWRREKRYK